LAAFELRHDPGVEYEASGEEIDPRPAPRIGVFGGTFDPPHSGHVAAAQACLDELSLDRVLFVVANDPWQKAPVRAVTPAADRLAMVEAAVAGHPGLEASPMEVERGGPSYTIDTVEELMVTARGSHGDPPDLYLIVGADLVPDLPTWERVDQLRALVTLTIVLRPPRTAIAAPAGWRSVVVQGPGFDVSSSEVRDRLEQGLPNQGLLPDAVIRCIRSRGLYAGAR